MKRKVTMGAGVALLVIVWGVVMWNKFFSNTQIAFVNHQVITLGQIAKSNDNDRVKLSQLGVEELHKIGNYDVVLINGMGLRITAEQRSLLQQAAHDGVCVITTLATNPANEIVSADSAAVAAIKGYLQGGGLRNYRNMLTYIRRHLDGKTWDTKEPDVPRMREQKQFYHIDPSAPDEEELDFDSLADYERFLKKHNLLKQEAPRIVITGQMGEPRELIAALERSGNVVYPVRNIQLLLQSKQIDLLRPAAVINMAHGRMGESMVSYLTRRNIPLFAPLNVNRLVDEWEADKMGMNGGFLSQSVVMPEIDGAIRPYALFAHQLDEEGLQQPFTMPDRLETFVQMVNNQIALQRKPNSDKRVVIYYYKGPGQSALTAAGMEVAPSLFNLLKRMKNEGYRIENLPASADELSDLIQRQGALFNAYAQGAKADFLANGHPKLISSKLYHEWTAKAVSPALMAEVEALDGPFPGSYLSTEQSELALPCVDLGHVVLLPQLAAGAGEDDFAIVHGTDAAPPHAYIASYLWAQYGFKADVMIHFGTHGSLEFTPKKQVALSRNDWADLLVGAMPHLYIYSIGDVGEGIIAKRRSYATLQSHLTPPFMESEVRGIYKELLTSIQQYNDLLYAEGKPNTDQAALRVKRFTVELGIHRELRLDSLVTVPYTAQEIARIETFAEELANEKITGELYTLGQPYSAERISSSVYAMSTDPIAYSLLALDKMRGKAADDVEKHSSLFTRHYLQPARERVTQLLNGSLPMTDETVCSLAGITMDALIRAREIERSLHQPQDRMAKMRAMQTSHPDVKHPGGKGGSLSVKESAGYSREEKEMARVIMELERTVRNVVAYKQALEQSPEMELVSLLNAMNGGFTAPSPGGDPIANPNTLPTGRNLYAVNAEATPSEVAWERGKALAQHTIRMYQERHHDSIPRKVSYTLWSGEFVETEGATIAQILYMLGVEPIRDAFGRVTDIRLIPSEQLGRPRIDVVVQTSGQLRDIAASRLFLISRAVEMAAAAKEDRYDNYVTQSVVEAERKLIARGLSPKVAREVSTYRVFGGVNGNYGTGITDRVQSGDRWESSREIADLYLQNMGAFYGSEKAWEQVQQFALEAALTQTDAVVQPRQSNTWGALSLDHVYEFMGGMNLAIRHVTGKEPDAYMSDYRNRNHMRMQELKEAIGIESRTTLFNPAYIREKMKGSATAAAGFAEIVQNTYGWNVMKPDVIDNEMWDELYEVYVQDKFGLEVRDFFEQTNPAALQEMTAVMMETARKKMWSASAEQLAALAKLHTELVEKHQPSCSNAVCNNSQLRAFIASKTTPERALLYQQRIQAVRETSLSNGKSMVLKSEQLNDADKTTTHVSNTVVAGLVVVSLAVVIGIVRHRRKKREE